VVRYTLRQLAYFVTASETGTTSAAAARQYMSQSAMSSALTDLERALGVQLLIRDKARGLSLTAAGRGLLPQARRLLAGAEDLESFALDFGQRMTGRLIVGCHVTIAPFVLPRLLRGFASLHPGVELDFVEGSLPELRTRLLEGACELAIVYRLDTGPKIDEQELYAPYPHVLLHAEHRLAGEREGVWLRDLEQDPLVLLDVPPSEHFFRIAFAVAGVTPHIRYRTVSFEHARTLVSGGLGYTLLTQRLIGDHGYWGRSLVSVPIRDAVPPQPIVLAHAAGVRRTRRAEVFAEYCVRELSGDS
jgi:DNA-binding transcriptional LysR family regulator